MERKERLKAIYLLLATAVLWSFGGVLVKKIAWNPLAIAGMRSLVAAPVLLFVLRRSHLNWSNYQIGGAICYAATVILYVVATKLTTSANAILLQYTAPIYVAIFSNFLLKEKITTFDVFTIFTTIIGIILFFLDKITFINIWGNICALLSGMFFGGLVLMMRKQKTQFPLGSIFLGNIMTGLVCLPFMFQSIPGPESWFYLVLMGILQLGLSHILYSIAIKKITAIDGIMIPIVEPVLNPIWVLVFVGEIPGRWAILGGVVAIGSVLVRAFNILLKKKEVDA